MATNASTSIKRQDELRIEWLENPDAAGPPALRLTVNFVKTMYLDLQYTRRNLNLIRAIVKRSADVVKCIYDSLAPRAVHHIQPKESSKIDTISLVGSDSDDDASTTFYDDLDRLSDIEQILAKAVKVVRSESQYTLPEPTNIKTWSENVVYLHDILERLHDPGYKPQISALDRDRPVIIARDVSGWAMDLSIGHRIRQAKATKILRDSDNSKDEPSLDEIQAQCFELGRDIASKVEESPESKFLSTRTSLGVFCAMTYFVWIAGLHLFASETISRSQWERLRDCLSVLHDEGDLLPIDLSRLKSAVKVPEKLLEIMCAEPIPYGSGDEDYEDMQQGEDGSRFPKHPPGYLGLTYDPPQYRSRFPGQITSPTQSFHAFAAHPYAQSSLRTGVFNYEGDRKRRLDDTIRLAEEEHEAKMLRRGSMFNDTPRPHRDPQTSPYLAFPQGHNFASGPVVGAASAGRSLLAYGHAGYPGPSPNNSLNSNFVPPPVKNDPYPGQGRFPMISPQGLPTPLAPPLPLNLPRNGSQSMPDSYPPLDNGAQPTTYNSAAYRSPNSYQGPSPLDAGINSNQNLAPTNSSGTQEAEGEGDVDGEPMPSTQMSINAFLPTASSFGNSYTFDRRFTDDSDLSHEISMASNPLGPTATNAQVTNGSPTIDGDAPFQQFLSMIQSSVDANGVDAQASIEQSNQLIALQQLQAAGSTHPGIPATPTYIAQYANTQFHFSSRQMELLQLYRMQLCNLQYHIAHSANSSIADEIFDLAMHSQTALYGTLTLTSLYKIRLRGMQAHWLGVPDDELTEARAFKKEVENALDNRRQTPMLLDNGDAMAALHMVSAVLFEGVLTFNGTLIWTLLRCTWRTIP